MKQLFPQGKVHAKPKAIVVGSQSPPMIAMTGKAPSLRSVMKATRPSVPENGDHSPYTPGKWDIWMLGITIVIGGQYFRWNAGLAAGLYSYLIAYFLVASAYITLCCCTSEITGALPFAGGAYGLSRCTLGFYPAFMIGCCEALEYIVYVSTSVISFVDMVVLVIPVLESVKPLVWAAFYISALFFHLKSDRVFWIFNMAIGSISIGIVVLFCLGSLPHVDFHKHIVQDPNLRFVDGFAGFMKALPLAPWFFVGVEALNLASDQVAQPKLVVPFAQVTCVLTLFVTGLAVFLTVVSLPPDLSELVGEPVPFNNCFERLFNVSHEVATILSLPATYATAFGFMWCYGKLIAAMATSRLLPPSLSKVSHRHGTPYAAITAGSTLSYSLCLLVYGVPKIATYLYIICIMCGFMSYIGQCIGYISLKLSYKNIKSSSFKNPFGIFGALYSLSVWVLSVVAIVGYQGNGGVEVLVLGCAVAALSVFYFVYSKKRQTFSPQENRILLVAHVMKFNDQRSAASRAKWRQQRTTGMTGRMAESRNTTGSGGSQFTDNNNHSVRGDSPASATVVPMPQKQKQQHARPPPRNANHTIRSDRY